MAEQLPGPGPLTQAAIDKARALPDNQLDINAGTTDFKSADLSVGVRKTWANGWGVGAWVGAKLGAGKPVGSAGVTVTKKLGLLGELESMNWLQRNLPSRESWLWTAGTLLAILTYLSAHFDALTAAFEIAPVWQERIELVAGLLAAVLAKQSFSNMPSKEKQSQAIDLHITRKLEKLDQDIDDLDGPPRAS